MVDGFGFNRVPLCTPGGMLGLYLWDSYEKLPKAVPEPAAQENMHIHMYMYIYIHTYYICYIYIYKYVQKLQQRQCIEILHSTPLPQETPQIQPVPAVLKPEFGRRVYGGVDLQLKNAHGLLVTTLRFELEVAKSVCHPQLETRVKP